MIALDNDALVAAFQLTPSESVAPYRARVRYFIHEHGALFMVPAVVLSEYLIKFEGQERQQEFAELLRRHVHIAPFNQLTAEIASDLGRRFAAGRSLAAVARQVGVDRICLKADLLIVATALQHSATAFVTNDNGADQLAKFAGLDSHLLINLPDPPPPRPRPAPARPSTVAQSLFDQTDPQQPE